MCIRDSGDDDKKITLNDAAGVALASAQELNKRLQAKDRRIEALEESNEALEQRNRELEERVARIEKALLQSAR